MRVFEKVPKVFSGPAQERWPEVFQPFAFQLLAFLVLLHEQLVLANLDLRVIPDGAARLDQQLVDAPKVQVALGDGRAVVHIEMQVSRAVGVQDVDEAGVVAIEEELWHVVVGRAHAVTVAVHQDLFYGHGAHDFPQTGVGEIVKVRAEGFMPLSSHIDDHDLAAFAAVLRQDDRLGRHGRARAGQRRGRGGHVAVTQRLGLFGRAAVGLLLLADRVGRAHVDDEAAGSSGETVFSTAVAAVAVGAVVAIPAAVAAAADH